MELSIDYYLRKVSRILRGHYDEVRLQVTYVRINNDEFADVFIFNKFNNIIYMDSIDINEVTLLKRALNIICQLDQGSDFTDGFMLKFTNCIAGGHG